MAYIGNQPTDNFVTFATQNFSTSATSSYTLDHAVSNENEIALFINNVRQHPGSGKAYTATGTALTLSANTASTDVMYCIFLGRAIQSTVPSTNSITAAMVSNDLISGKDALTSEPASTDELLVSDAGTLKRIDYSLIKGKITNAQQWRLTTDFTDDANPIASNLEQVDHDGAGKIGSDMTQSSGIFTFPDTGIWYIAFKGAFLSGSGDGANYNFTEILTTIDNSSYSSRNNTAAASNGAAQYMSCFSTTIFDVTSTTNCKVKFKVNVLDSGITTLGSSTITLTGMDFIRLGDT